VGRAGDRCSSSSLSDGVRRATVHTSPTLRV
jgi:hypothetical protein